MSEPWELLKLLADSTRLRILNILRQDEASVAELQEILDMGQSRISSHLGQLRNAGLVRDRREGKKTYYTWDPPSDRDARLLLDAALTSLGTLPGTERDNQHLERIRHWRKQSAEQYFNSVAGKLSKTYCPGRSWEAMGLAFLQLVPNLEVVDLGAGEGAIGALLAKRAARVVCVDSSEKMVEVGMDLAARHNLTNLSYILGNIEDVPLADASFDVAILSQALHHAQQPTLAIAEAKRLLRPGGTLIIIDLREHSFEKARELYNDTWLGFRENALYEWLDAAGFQQIAVNVVSREAEPPHFETLLATAILSED
ncbi:MAG: ArsR/SmtB family transcription factor [Opitutales bacterium]